MTNQPRVSGRMLWGLIVLTLGVLWTLDNLGQIDASQVLRWWPLLALGWGALTLSGLNGPCRRPWLGWLWVIVGGLSILRPLGIAHVDIFELFWPVLLILVGGSLVYRAWSGRAWVEDGTDAGPRLNASAFMAGSKRRVVAQEFAAGDVNAVIAGTTVDFRAAKLAQGRGEVDVFAMWGGIDLIVPPEWRVVGEVTPILGVFQDTTLPPAGADAPTLVVRGTVVMGGIEVRNDDRPVIRTRARDGSVREVRVGPGGVVIAGIGRAQTRGGDPAGRE